jgi:hypothetical protein
MKSRSHWILAGFSAVLLSVASWALMQAPPATRSLAEILPSGPVLVLEAQDFSSLLADWNGSAEKQQWLDSANYDMFSRSRLFYKLGEAHKEFAAAAGFSPGMELVESIAGTESSLALYDIGDLRFLYVTRLGSARALENMLWQSRANFEPRNAAGSDYYIRTDAQSGRQAVFAATDDYLLLATAEEPLAQALTLLARQTGVQAASSDTWYRDAAQASAGPGVLRLTLNMEAVARAPQFRSYWIQQNISELRQYRAGVIDLHREGSAMREERVFLRADDVETAAANESSRQALAQLLRLAPPQAGFYRASAAPQSRQVIELLREKLLDPSTNSRSQPDYAPQVSLSDGTVGSQAALETRIDEPPPALSSGRFASEALESMFARNPVAAVLQTESSRPGVEGVFVNNDATIALLGASDWDFAAVLEDLESSIRGRLTVSGIGTSWTLQPFGGQPTFVLSAVRPIFVAGQGRYLLVSNSADSLVSVLSRMTPPPVQPQADQPAAAPAVITYAAGLRHAQERGNYTKLMAHLDFLQGGQMFGNGERPPYLFSESIASLSETLSRAETVTRRVEDRGASVADTVIYQLQP